MTNQYSGLHRGPIDHDASSVINSIANGTIHMGSSVKLHTGSFPSSELLPRVQETNLTNQFFYGIVVGGDFDGTYGDGTTAGGEENDAAVGGETVVVVTKGRGLARVVAVDFGNIPTQVNPGDPLISAGQLTAGGNGILMPAKFVNGAILSNARVGAVALQTIPAGDLDIIAVDVQREGEI